jgi:hypothetical protein
MILCNAGRLSGVVSKAPGICTDSGNEPIVLCFSTEVVVFSYSFSYLPGALKVLREDHQIARPETH